MSDKVKTRIEDIREKRGWSRKVLAERAGVTERTIYNIETGRVGISLYSACMIADGLGVTLNDLMGRKPGEKYMK